MADQFLIDPERIITRLKKERDELSHKNLLLETAFEQLQEQHAELQSRYNNLAHPQDRKEGENSNTDPAET